MEYPGGFSGFRREAHSIGVPLAVASDYSFITFRHYDDGPSGAYAAVW